MNLSFPCLKWNNFQSVFLFSLLSIVFSLNLSGQNIDDKTAPGKKGSFYAYWGWNRGFFTNSDIHFTGTNYNFTLYDVVAKDTPTKFSFDTYLNPLKLTIPQTNFRIGYNITDHYDISFGIDHMKYVVQQDQEVYISGRIDESGTEYDGVYNKDILKLKSNFLEYEHTDGLTYFNVELRRTDKILDLKKWVHFDLSLNILEGVGIGFMFPRTDSKLLGKPRNNEFHVAGYGTGLLGGINIEFLKYFFIQSELKAGFINLTDVRTTNSETDKATQSIAFLQPNIVFGGRFSLWNRNK